MIVAPNTQGQNNWVGIVQWAPETSVSEEIVDIFRNYNKDSNIGSDNGLVPTSDKPLSEPIMVTDTFMRQLVSMSSIVRLLFFF